jgi:hypothetical protein
MALHHSDPADSDPFNHTTRREAERDEAPPSYRADEFDPHGAPAVEIPPEQRAALDAAWDVYRKH